jgi:hypothetical protein
MESSTLGRDTGRAMSRKANDPIKREERARKYREAIALYLGGEFVEAVGAFERTDDDPLGWRHSDIGMIVNVFTVSSREKKRKEAEGGLSNLPDYFLLAVTKDRLHAFARRGGRYSKKVKNHVADFPREDVRIYPGDDSARVAVIELTEEGQEGRVEVRSGGPQVKSDVINPNKNPWASEVVAALGAAGLSE